MIYEETTKKILRAFYRVYNVLGFGFLEKVYENALCIEMAKCGLGVRQQLSIPVYYEGNIVGEYFSDIVVSDLIVVELKVASAICDEHFAQLTNYLKATDKEIGLLLNFGKKPEFKRIFFTNEVKNSIKRFIPKPCD